MDVGNSIYPPHQMLMRSPRCAGRQRLNARRTMLCLPRQSKCDQPLGSAAVPLDITCDTIPCLFLVSFCARPFFARRLATGNVCVYVSNQIASKKLSFLMSVIFAHGPYRHTKVETSGARSRGSGKMGDQRVETSSFGERRYSETSARSL